MTRQTQRCFKEHFSVEFSWVVIKRNALAEFLTGVTAPSRPIARRMSASCDNYEPINEIPVENMDVSIAPGRIIERRATHIGDQTVVRDFEDGDSVRITVRRNRKVHFEDEQYHAAQTSLSGNIEEQASAANNSIHTGVDSSQAAVQIPTNSNVNFKNYSNSDESARTLPNLIPIGQLSAFSNVHSTPNLASNQVTFPKRSILRHSPPAEQTRSNLQEDGPNYSFSNLITNSSSVLAQSRILADLPPARQIGPNLQENHLHYPKPHLVNSIVSSRKIISRELPPPQQTHYSDPYQVANEMALAQSRIIRNWSTAQQTWSNSQENCPRSANLNVEYNPVSLPHQIEFELDLQEDADDDDIGPMPNSLYEPIRFAEWCRKRFQK